MQDQPRVSVRLAAFTPSPFDIAVASARTCYSPRAILPSEVTDGQRARVGEATWQAGHHTPFQHACFTFAIENVSRQLVWSFLHAQPYYNSDQSSQRYVTLKEPRAFAPKLEAQEARAYAQAVEAAWAAYGSLSQALTEKLLPLMEPIARIKGAPERQAEAEAEKKAIELARYVLPVAAHTSLYHTVSLAVLMRYARTASACDCPREAGQLVSAMLSEAAKADPQIAQRIRIEEMQRDAVPGLSRKKPSPTRTEGANAAFDAALGGFVSRLASFQPDAETLVADAVRETLGETSATLCDDEAIALAVDPGRNPALLDTLNSWQHVPAMRALNIPSYVFKKKISHSADSQDQRHRTTPAARPLLSRTHSREPDFIIPEAVARDASLKKEFADAVRALWEAKNALIDTGVQSEDAIYLLPNATAIRLTETGRLIDLLHKWRMRTCFNAQEEIFRASMDELSQVLEVHPRLAGHSGPPCFQRKSDAFMNMPCPEGARWCGIDVWRNFPQVRRPF
jgi:flavin-dependent thymidylate synthase